MNVMHSFIAANFTDGPVPRIVDAAIRAQESHGELLVENEIARFLRVVRAVDGSQWTRSETWLADLLNLVAEVVDEDSPHNVPQQFKDKLSHASEGMDRREYVFTLAGLVRLLAKDGIPSYEELPMSRWEAQETFCMICGFGANWVELGEFSSISQSMAAAIDSEHPYCRQFLLPIALDAQRALVIFPSNELLAKNIGDQASWLNVDSINEVLDAINSHMANEHIRDAP